MKDILIYLRNRVPETHLRVWGNPVYYELDSRFPSTTKKVIFVIVNNCQMVAFIKTESKKSIYLRFYYEAHNYVFGQIVGPISKKLALEIFESLRSEPSEWNYSKFEEFGFEYIYENNEELFKLYQPLFSKIYSRVFKTKDLKKYVREL
ncbi:MAG: hypothetical protein UR85_C0004G0069 [Candidatus Nomurabacteria bacterium GW2011_GWF2_35_66]|uniref:Uncharacterized protein n=1 Tax=Candidatus Nomurabacteria bacterium GW2011_GWE1_35_16 TaxID=1618761 RepID=A0A0G0BBX5_9BACT|nr:MAG: hypothetical protein UR55_C0002G0068 [Candidatus Nomurabacteria bacterium GW2011_GWF1_34_20]KKP63647.1 MAG: hypothetical protein UR57_C0002G0068 [Candidatus Nomurabacteria bacterium GW2011_GWE2_34_25]KKP66849.1 MAG: hypothetical protein UR64_C0002G0065 [Candidatus Nomurabacteria bacterium GW2011_GWE1_35_16]KKP83475.1 MAG: hypothetical protein UR85_C0004G0069 [Candidatus Nomurabacteria bacterium GW2011_GWF2_35_66]HAE36593.1 hypothetical protein [Candidatus Nomurabacteria bacterium]